MGEFVTAYQARRDRSVAGLNQTPGIDCLSPQGAFYLYPSCAGLIGKHQPDETVIKSSHDFANYLLNDWSVAVVPGSAFELDPHFRISTATADDELDAGIAQIKKAVAALV